ncbi:MAG: LysM peptidoglycan-binding domain-containing protein, partial [Chloroflexi bacterium]|nr:LysM peptidoglycan-binding domain-containing protein [Chloroflexota bacterium]
MSRRTRPRRTARQTPQLHDRIRLFMPLRSWRLQLLGAAVALAAAILSAQSFASAREAVASYLIQPGDTLSAIATTTGVPLDRLVGINSIKNPDFIVAGQILSLDGSAASTTQAPLDQAAGPRYTVRTGDTLWDISQATGTPLDSLLKLNDLANGDELSVGQVLRLPATASVQPAAAIQKAAASTPTKPKAIATPTPKPTRPPTPAPSPLQQRIAAEALRVGGPSVHVGAAATNLVTGEKTSLRADEAFPSASVMKLPILVELERQIADAIHPQSVNDTMAHLGLGSTRFLNLFTDTRSASSPGMNQTTP